MNLFYCRNGNFGDELNTYVWPRLLGDQLESGRHLWLGDDLDDPRLSLFLGIGTIINSKVPRQPRKLVFGSGCGYGTAPELDGRWEIVFVRGPKSAQVLGLGGEAWITDPALLVRDCGYDGSGPPLKVSFMPHASSVGTTDWERLCARLGVAYLNPLSPVEVLLNRLSRSQLVIAEAMHAAIVADALGIPWVPVRLHSHIAPFKWEDWCESLRLRYAPVRVHRAWRFLRRALTRKRGPVRRAISNVISLHGLKLALSSRAACLSDERVREEKAGKMHAALAQVRRARKDA